MLKPSALICAGLSLVLLSSTVSAALLSQSAYDQFISEQTKIVNETKHILDEDDQKADAQTQRQAFCKRLKAYQDIQKVSEENSSLDMAPMMAMVAKSFLDRQDQSLSKSGMTTTVFCKNRDVE
ncbi:hypothetical protein [Acinetobacter pseudolwoffii]|uniref:hypothetical protein n=1 Tax=Acinetobacter pseudolwoffii TaxID=2053287 RepID=UPI000C2513DD|nr:hypothetical protein [Acinetobacter pseudolwoffii]PJI30405.1 hypothetical protein CU478_02465 [Acinetobacter pseudolwoffii]